MLYRILLRNGIEKNHLKYNGFEEHVLIKVANDIRNIRPNDINDTLTIN